MKSVVAEASTISKAIELAWQKAGNPKEFLIKVFQEPQRNIFGLTKTSAKVGIFFDDAALTQKIKNASQKTIPASQSATQVAPITPIKPINPRPQAPKQANPRPAKSQAKVEVNLSSMPTKPTVNPNAESITTNPVNKNNSNHKPNPNRRNNNRATNKPNPNRSNNVGPNNQAKNLSAGPKLAQPTEQSLVDQVISLIANESKTKNMPTTTKNNNQLTANQSQIATDSNITPHPTRSKYYRRRKPRSNRPNPGTGEGSEQNKPATPIKKNED